MQPGLEYFQDKFGDDTKHPMPAFKAARLFSPTLITRIQPTAADIDQLKDLPFLSASTLEHLKEELPTYIAKASVLSSLSDCNSLIDILEWWKSNSTELLYWSKAAQWVFLIQPSSAAAERVFSILNRFSDTQTNSLEDYVESTCMLQYNKRKN